MKQFSHVIIRFFKETFTIRLVFLSLFVLLMSIGSLVWALSGSEKHQVTDIEEVPWTTLTVTATAYNADSCQTDDSPDICAWGDPVRPGIIAVSRDLEAMGLTRGKEVHVEGFGKMTVLDRMHPRKRNQIDIFMEEYRDAVSFGVQHLDIRWHPENRPS